MKCPDCHVEAGQSHHDGCDIERCPLCSGQRLSCGCGEVEEEDRMPWTGEWPGEKECREHGMYAVLVAGQGWVSCDKDTKGAVLDLNRFAVEFVWDMEQRKYVRRT
jgi:Zn-finger nucleic acid-binding protein